MPVSSSLSITSSQHSDKASFCSERSERDGLKNSSGSNRSVWRKWAGWWRRLVVTWALLIFGLSLGGNVLMQSLGWYFNTSDSLPYGLYRADYREQVNVSMFTVKYDEQRAAGTVATGKDTLADGMAEAAHDVAETVRSDGNTWSLQRGELVLVCLPENVGRWALKRHYLQTGKCSGGTAPLGKHVMALPGDEVVVAQEGIRVNGQLLTASLAALTDALGRKMPVPAGLTLNTPVVLPEGVVLLLNPRSNSFDSRYLGPIAIDQIIARLTPLLTW